MTLKKDRLNVKYSKIIEVKYNQVMTSLTVVARQWRNFGGAHELEAPVVVAEVDVFVGDGDGPARLKTGSARFASVEATLDVLHVTRVKN